MGLPTATEAKALNSGAASDPSTGKAIATRLNSFEQRVHRCHGGSPLDPSLQQLEIKRR